MKLMTFIKFYSTMKILKEDNKPVELVDNLFIGSIGAAHNKKALKESGITHIVIAASGLKKLFPDDFKYLQFDLLDSETEDIKKHIVDAKQELFNLRFQQATGIIEKPSRIKELRHDVARCKTVLRERELEVK